MRWQDLLASALIGFCLTVLGCDTDQPFVAPPTDPALLPSSTAAAASASPVAGRTDESAARAQAPDTPRPVMVAQLPPISPPATVQPASHGAPAPGSTAPGYTAAHVAVIVNGEPILDEEIRAAAHDMLLRLDGLAEPERSKRQAEVLQLVLNALIEREVVLEEAFERIEKSPGGKNTLEKIKEIAAKDFEKNCVRPAKEMLHMKTDEEFKEFLVRQGVTYEMQKRLWERKYMMEEYLHQSLMPMIESMIGHVQLVEYYESQPEAFKVDDEVEWQDLFIAAGKHQTREAAQRFAEVQAQRVRQAEHPAEDFVELCEKFDDGDSKLRKSQGLGHKHGEIRPQELEDALFKLKEGDVAVVEQSSGFHVVRVVKRQFAGIMPFDEKTQKLIKDKLRQELMQREMKRMVADMKSKAVIEVRKDK